MMSCKNCNRPIDCGKWCSDRCRKAFARKSDTNPDKPKSDTQSRTEYRLPVLPPDTLLECNKENGMKFLRRIYRRIRYGRLYLSWDASSKSSEYYVVGARFHKGKIYIEDMIVL